MTKKEARKYSDKLKMVQRLKEMGVPVISAKRLSGMKLVCQGQLRKSA